MLIIGQLFHMFLVNYLLTIQSHTPTIPECPFVATKTEQDLGTFQCMYLLVF